MSGIEKIANNQSALADQYKHIENIIATNATVAKEKEEKDKKYVDALEGRLSKMENILQTFQEGQKPVEICTTPKQTESEVIEGSITVQKTQVNNADSSDKPQLEKVLEPSTSQSSVSMDTVENINTSGTGSIKINRLKKHKHKPKIVKIKKEKKKKIPEERKEQDPPTFMSLLFNFLINLTNGMFTLLNNITSSPTGIIWGILVLLAIFATRGQAMSTNESSIIHQSPIDLFLSNSNSGYLLYGIETVNYQTTDLLEEGIVIKSSELETQNIIQPDSYQASDSLEKEKIIKYSEENNKKVESSKLNIQNLVQPGNYRMVLGVGGLISSHPIQTW